MSRPRTQVSQQRPSPSSINGLIAESVSDGRSGRALPLRAAPQQLQGPPVSPAETRQTASPPPCFRGNGGGRLPPAVSHEDFEEALKRLRAGSVAQTASF
jgi:hypothetical protein